VGLFQRECEKEFFNKISCEVIKIAGTPIVLYLLQQIQDRVDPLYNEINRPADGKFEYDIFNVKGLLLKPEDVFQEGDRGANIEWDAQVWFDRSSLEAAGVSRMPNAGDVVCAWNRYYDIIQQELMGYLDDINYFTQVQCDLKNRSKFEPQRKIA